MLRSRIGLFFLVFSILPGAFLGAQDAESPGDLLQSHPEGEVAISRLKSPFCPGLMLEVCAHPDSKVLRDTLQAMAHDGASADSLVSWMLGTYGEEYRAVPQARGSGLWAWIMPPLVLAVGLLLVVVVLQRLRRREGPSEGPAQPLSPEDESVLAEALKELQAAEEVPF